MIVTGPRQGSTASVGTPRASADERVARSTFAGVYPLHVTKVEKKGRTEEELKSILRR